MAREGFSLTLVSGKGRGMDFIADPWVADHWPLVLGLVAALVAAWAWHGDRRRMRRSDPDRVGIMPWTTLFFWSFVLACIVLGIAVKAWLAGG